MAGLKSGLASIVRRIVRVFAGPVVDARAYFRWIPYSGKSRFCPVCGFSSGSFGAAGVEPRNNAMCMRCGALERHRLVWLFFEKRTDLFRRSAGTSMLHVAPEPSLERRLRRRIGAGYVTADSFDPRAMVRMDVTDIQYMDESFDVIYCSHVLEHVNDDRKAMREFCRVLKAGGWAVLLVPIAGEKTVEDLSISDPAERRRIFGQEDHVRCYGRDYVERLRGAGFHVEVTTPADFLTDQEVVRMGITSAAGDIYLCIKSASHTS